jgi:hypothetical protein
MGKFTNYGQIPEELRQSFSWVGWRTEKRVSKNGVVRQAKPLYNVRTGKLAKCNDPFTWSSFDDALAAVERGEYEGPGLCLTQGVIGIDLDGCRHDGSNESFADEIVRELNSYTEISPSGGGLHIIVKGELPDGERQYEFGDRPHHGVGLYDSARGRYLTMTGDRIHGDAVNERTAELRRIHTRLFPPKTKAKKKPPPPVSGVSAMSDDELIERARKAKDGGKFARLWDGDTSGYTSPSEADLALCAKLAFWTNRDAARIDVLFRRSGLMRDKWERIAYRDATIARAIEQTSETWKPPQQTFVFAASTVDATIENLNRMDLFHGRIQFQSVSRRGSMILATTTRKQQIIWPTMAELTSFARARAAIADGADVLLPQPPARQVSKLWDPIAEIIIKLAARDAIRVEHVLKAECKDLLILMWRYTHQATAKNSKEFMDFLIAISQAVRDREQPAPPCVFVAEECVWVHVPTFRNWLSMPMLTNRLYPLADIRQGLLLLGFDYVKDVTRGADGDSESASLWRGPLDVLLE